MACFFLFLAVFNSLFMISGVIEKERLKLAIVIPAGVPIKLAKEKTDIPQLVTNKTMKDLSK